MAELNTMYKLYVAGIVFRNAFIHQQGFNVLITPIGFPMYSQLHQLDSQYGVVEEYRISYVIWTGLRAS